MFGEKSVAPGEYSLFVDLKSPREWTLIISSWAAQAKFNPQDKDALWGAYGYTPDKDVARVPMTVGAAVRRRAADLELRRHDHRRRQGGAHVGQNDGEHAVHGEQLTLRTVCRPASC